MFNVRARLPGCVLVLVVVLAARSVLAGGLASGATLCLNPINLPFRAGDDDPRRAGIEQRLVKALGEASFHVVAPSAVRPVRDRELRASGGYIDPANGWRVPDRYRTYRERVARAFARELGCDAQLVASVVLVHASFASGVASWDGASAQVSSTGRVVLNVLSGTVESGWVGAFSLWLSVQDLDGNDVVFRTAGIEPIVHFAVLKDRDLVPEDQWLTDGAKLDAAIASAIGAWGTELRVSPGGS